MICEKSVKCKNLTRIDGKKRMAQTSDCHSIIEVQSETKSVQIGAVSKHIPETAICTLESDFLHVKGKVGM